MNNANGDDHIHVGMPATIYANTTHTNSYESSLTRLVDLEIDESA